MKKLPLLLDCDPGADDVFALLWALIMHQSDNNPFELQCITTLWWNVSADNTYLNGLRMCEFVGVTNVPVWKDTRPIEWSGDASHIHWSDGIGNLSTMLPQPTIPKTSIDSVQLMIDTIKKYPWEITLLVTWPMTNLAAAEKKEPGILNQCKYIIAMWWSFSGGNVTPTSEFNVWYDAASAKQVVDVANNLIMIPLDVTQSFVYTPEDSEQFLGEINHSNKAEFVRELTKFVVGTNRKFRETHYQNGFFVHDGHTVWFLLYPHLYRGTFIDVRVETQGEFTQWQTVWDWRNHPRKDYKKTYVITDVDRDGFLEALVQDFKEFDRDA